MPNNLSGFPSATGSLSFTDGIYMVSLYQILSPFHLTPLWVAGQVQSVLALYLSTLDISCPILGQGSFYFLRCHTLTLGTMILVCFSSYLRIIFLSSLSRVFIFLFLPADYCQLWIRAPQEATLIYFFPPMDFLTWETNQQFPGNPTDCYVPTWSSTMWTRWLSGANGSHSRESPGTPKVGAPYSTSLGRGGASYSDRRESNWRSPSPCQLESTSIRLVINFSRASIP